MYFRLEERKKSHNTKPAQTDPKLLELQRRLEAKKEERKQKQESAKLRPSKKSAQRLRELNASKVRNLRPLSNIQNIHGILKVSLSILIQFWLEGDMIYFKLI